jgi:lysyl-tRNA synthetase class 2
MTATDWRPRAGLGIAGLRARMLGSARAWFARRSILEISPPMIARTAVSDPNIESVELRLALDRSAPCYLHTSPEYAMKRLLAADFPDIYCLGRVFRDGEAGRRHQPEFTMAEWYRRDADLADMMADTESFVGELLDQRGFGTPPLRLDYRQAFVDTLRVDPLRADADDLARLAGADRRLRDALGGDRDAWLDLLLTTRIAPHFASDRLTTLHHYPASQAALARLCPDDPAVADRFEVFVGELELANGYVELTDAAEQRRRFDNDQAMRRRSGRPIRPLDERFLACLDAGLPPCAGVAVGFDRLVMINAGCDDIRDVLHFPFEPRHD